MGPLIFLSINLLITITGSSGSRLFGHCDISQCDAELPSQFMQEFPPTEEYLEEVCPSLPEALECYLSAISECTGLTIEELLASGNATIVEVLTISNNLKNLVQDLCDEDNELSKNYKVNVICFKQIIVEQSMECYDEGEKLYEAYLEKLTSLEEISSERPGTEVRCLSEAYNIACLLKEVRKKCGELAKDTLQKIVKRVITLKFRICSESDILNLRGQFLNFLEEQGGERDFLSAAFEFRKRRK